MTELDMLIKKISRRGDQGGPGLLELLDWCGKTGLCQVTEQEARTFWLRPEEDYSGDKQCGGGA